MLLRPIFTGILLIIFSFGAAGQTIRTHVNTDSVSVGDVFSYSLVLQLDGEYDEIIYPDTVFFPPVLELADQQQFRISSFSDSTVFRLQFFGSEDVHISSLPVTLVSGDDSTFLYTNPITIYFKPFVAEGDTSLKPIKPIFSFPGIWWPWIVAALLAAGFLVWWIKFRDKPEPVVEAPKKEFIPFQNPLEELERTLQSIRENQKIAETKDFKLYYSSISDAIRTYYEDLYQIPALESTSRELLRYLDAYGVDQNLVAVTRNILNKADLVKFAKLTPTLDDAHAAYQLAIDFLDRARVADANRLSRMKDRYEEQLLKLEDQEGEV